MKYTRKWKQYVCIGTRIAESCRVLTDDGWTVHSIVAASRVNQYGETGDGAIIIVYKDEPDLSGGVPR